MIDQVRYRIKEAIKHQQDLILGGMLDEKQYHYRLTLIEGLKAALGYIDDSEQDELMDEDDG